MSKLSVEEIIRRAIEEGKFEELPGKGKPLNLDENPHEDPAWRMAHHMLRNAGFSLPWIETRREIEIDLEAARDFLARSRAWRDNALQQGSCPDWVEAEWERSLQVFQDQVNELNKRIRSNNLAVPSTRFQRRLIDPKEELQAVTRATAKP
jgi:DnaJ family protein C protein 28